MFCLCLVFLTGRIIAGEPNQIQTVHFATDAWPPYFIAGENGAAGSGVFVELIHKVFERIPEARAEFHFMPWSRALAEVKQGRMDALPGLIYTDERSEYLQFTVPLLKNSLALVYNKRFFPEGELRGDLHDFKGLNVAISRGYVMYDKLLEKFEGHEGTRVRPVGSDESLIKIVGSGRLKLGAMNAVTAVYLIEKYGFEKTLGLAQINTMEQDYYLAVSKGSPMVALIPAIDKAIADLKQDGAIEAMLKPYAIQ